MSAVPYTSGEQELLVSHTKKGSRMIATTQRVIWFDKDDALTIIPIQQISRVTKETKAVVRKEYILYLWRPNETCEWTVFSNEHDRDAMANAVQQAMISV